MQMCMVLLAVVIAVVNIDLAHCHYHSKSFSPETIRLWYKKIYDALNNYQYVPQLDYTMCYRKNGELFTRKLEDDSLMRSFNSEMKSIVIHSSIIANVSKVEEFSDDFNEIENTYYQVHQRISNENDPEAEKKLTNITELHLTEQKIKVMTDKMDYYINNGISCDVNLLNASRINQNFMNLLTKNCTTYVKLCSSADFLGQKLIDVYRYLASMEVEMVALIIDHNFLHEIYYNNKDAILEFRKIINNSIRRTRIYVILMMEILKESEFTPKFNMTKTESHADRNHKEISLELRNLVSQLKPDFSTTINKNEIKSDTAAQVGQKTWIKISNQQYNFLRQLRAINNRIDQIWCANTPSYEQRHCHEINLKIPCEMKKLKKESKQNIIKEMWNISKDMIKLLETIVEPPTTQDIFTFSGLVEYSDRGIFKNIEQAYKTTIHLSNSWDGIDLLHFEELLNIFITKFHSSYKMTPWDISKEIHSTIFKGCQGTKIWQTKLKENYCKSSSNLCSTDLQKTKLNTIFLYLAKTEMKNFIFNIFADILRTLLSKDDVFTNAIISNQLFNKLMNMKSGFFLRTKDYLDEIDEDSEIKSLKCKPFSWKTDIKTINNKSSNYNLKSSLLPAGILNFAVKSSAELVFIKLGPGVGSNYVKIDITPSSINRVINNQKKSNAIKNDNHVNEFLSPEKFVGYWIKWKGTEFSIGRARNSKALIKITDVNTSILSHFTISNADWILYDLPPSHQIDDNKAYRETCWVDNTVRVDKTNGIACRISSDRRDGYKLGTFWNNKCYVPIDKNGLLPYNSSYEVLLGTQGDAVIGGIRTTGEPLYVCPSRNGLVNGVGFDENYCRSLLI